MRCLVLPLVALAAALAQSPNSETLQGTLNVREGKPPALTTSGRGVVTLEGDPDTTKVLNDKRLTGAELQARGHFVAPGRFAVDPIHTSALRVRKDGSMKAITYWCDVCSIRTYSPGICWCCERETNLDLRDPDAP